MTIRKAASVLLLAAAACGPDDPVQPEPPTPTADPPAITAIEPGELVQSTEERTLTLTGTGFSPDATALKDGEPRGTRVLSSTSLEADLTEADVAQPDTLLLSVRTAAGVSGTVAVVVREREVEEPSGLQAELLDGGLIDAGAGVTCAVSVDREVLCWGGGDAGSPWTDDPTLPRPIDRLGPARAVHVGEEGDFACALDLDGGAHCWGSNRHGQLGRGTVAEWNAPPEPPAPVLGGHRFVDLGVGESHACGVTEEGEVYCWGDREAGQGSGPGSDPQPVRVELDVPIGDVAPRTAGTCALSNASEVYCWGRERVVDDTARAPFALPIEESFVSLSTEGSHNCGLTRSGALRCWFRWDGRTSDDFASLGPDRPRVTSAGSGSNHRCAATADGETYCTGDGRDGELGGGYGTVWRWSQIVRVRGDHRFVALAAGGGFRGAHTCGLTDTGEAYCWGSDEAGQLGSGAPRLLPRPVLGAGGLRFVQIQAADHLTHFGASLCGRTVDDRILCWGTAPTPPFESSLLAAGEPWPTPRPIPGAAGLRSLAVILGGGCGVDATGRAHCWGGEPGAVARSVAGDIRFDTLVAGPEHVCGLARDRETYCWGVGRLGRLGGGDFESASADAPVKVVGGHAFRSLTAGGMYSCGLDEAGKAWCWGSDAGNELGAFTSQVCESNKRCASEPLPVIGDHTFARIDAGLYMTCGVTGDGASYCWGGESYPAFCAFLPCSDRPVRVAEPGRYVAVVGRSRRLCGLDPEGRAYCWGMGSLGALPWEERTAADPRLVEDGALRFSSVVHAALATCGLDLDGYVHCWGARFNGEFGDGWSQHRWEPMPVAGGYRFLTEPPGG